MKRLFVALGCLLPLGLLAVTGCEDSTGVLNKDKRYKATGTVVLTGVLRDETGQELGTFEAAGIDGIRVALVQDGDVLGFVLSQAGHYTFEDLKNGDYDVASTVDNSTIVIGPSFTVNDTDVAVTDTLRVPPKGTVTSYPNPFYPSTTIRVNLMATGTLGINIIAPDQTIVRRLTNEVRPMGVHSFVWDSRDDIGREVPDGVYWAFINAAGDIQYDLLVKQGPMRTAD